MKKNAYLCFLLLSAAVSAQQKNNFVLNPDQTAEKNAHRILQEAKNDFFKSKNTAKPISDLQMNRNQLLMNNANFNTLTGGYYAESLNFWSITEPKPNLSSLQIRFSQEK